MVLYTQKISPRLQYIVGFIAKEWQAGDVRITSSSAEFKDYPGPKINYSDHPVSENEIWIRPYGLLEQNGIKDQSIDCFNNDGKISFFKSEGDTGFDILAATFYLLSRYEEYLPHPLDMYGRYAHENSLAFKQNFLRIPLVNVWLNDLKTLVQKKFPTFTPKPGSFIFLPTYDIDIAWSYKHKGWWRNAGGFLRSVFSGNWSLANERIRVLRGKQKDPFDAYGWLNNLHEQNQLKPYYFFLVPEIRGRYDKNISPSCAAMEALIRDHVIRYPIGIHPSWKSGDDNSLLKKEIDTLSRLNRNQILSSRQHYIRFNLPLGYRRLLENGIKYDFSMGYGSINGFRASVASPFYWYDLEKELQTDLLLFPFCYMEANSYFEQKNSVAEALGEMRQLYQATKMVNGYFIMIWHNSFLGTDRMFSGWREMYEQFIKEQDF